MMVGVVVARKEARKRWRSPRKERARERTSRIVFGDLRGSLVYYYYLKMSRWICGVVGGVENEVGCRRDPLEAGRDVFAPNQRA